MGTTNNLDVSAEFLKTAYTQLGFDQGALVPATPSPQLGRGEDWLERGDWQSLAAQVGAEAIFFVNRDPVIVFAKVRDPSPDVLRTAYSAVWCMSRPQLLFLSSPGQLMVLDLTKPPPRPNEAVEGGNRLIETVRRIDEVQTKLAAFHRERIESRAVFGEERFRDSANRADRALIRDLRTVRQQLNTVPLKARMKKPELRHLHALIGRSIFVRYLEDREVLVPSYFESVAARRPDWAALLAQSPSAQGLEPRMTEVRFLRVLQDKEFTYALFEQLADDFNGDTFPLEQDERDCIQQEHLDKLRGFLTGATSTQQQLFFFAYRFDVIPIELISAIYEEFYNERTGKDRNQGAHYTPPALAEFLLAHVLTPEVLTKKPRVLDPACGSGIFLVESFRRMVRHLWREQGGARITRSQLRRILREQIAGIDINEEAVRVAAFSLYLAFLHYQKPREINAERRLPYLKWVSEEERKQREKRKPGALFFDVLLHANSFDVVAGGLPPEITQRFGPSSVEVVVGNPPWGYPKKEDTELQEALAAMVEWCDTKKGRPIGDKEPSQGFIHLAQALLREGGRAGLLVSSGVLFKHHQNSRDFRRRWLLAARLEHVVNFAHVRHIFFSGPEREAKGISPFVSIVFEKTPPAALADNHFEYWSAKRTATVANTQSVVLNRGDMHWLSQRDCIADEELWKIYWWGGHRDAALIQAIERFPKLKEIPERVPNTKLQFDQGFKEASKAHPAGWLENYRELPPRAFFRYGAIDDRNLLPVPKRVERYGVEDVYRGRRLLVARGIKGDGVITARFETRKYCFRNSIHGVRFQGFEKWQEAVVTAIFWSSLARYYYFMTSGSWGLWHDEIHLEDIERMPICLPNDARLRQRIVRIVEELQEVDLPPEGTLFDSGAARGRLRKLERQLDDAVFDVYELNDAERDLVKGLCTSGLDFFYRNQDSSALRAVGRPAGKSGRFSDLSPSEDGLSAYLGVFLKCWNKELGPEAEFVWRVLSPPWHAPLLAVSFTTHYKNAPLPRFEESDAQAWSNVLATLEPSSRIPVGSSRIYVDTFFRHVSDHEVLFVKRNERRFWTRSAAREDAEAAMAHLIDLQNSGTDGRG